jgi:hypothetical protein
VNLAHLTNETSKTKQNEGVDYKSTSNARYNPIIYENRPAHSISQMVVYPRPRLR